MALSLSLFAGQALHAAPAGKVKTVNVHLRNDSQSAITIQAGDQQITLQPGKQSGLKLPEGTQLVNVSATPTHEAGAVIATVTSTLSGSTLVLN